MEATEVTIAKLLAVNMVLCAELAPTTPTGTAVLNYLAAAKDPMWTDKDIKEAALYGVIAHLNEGVTPHEFKLALSRLEAHYNIPPF